MNRPLIKPGVEAFNLVDQNSYSVRALAEMIAKSLGVRWNGRSIPLWMAKLIAAGGDFAGALTGKEFPMTSSRLNALTESTHFSSQKLLGTGFRYPQSTQEGIEVMVEWYKKRGRV